jgi:outer membrane biosynthesis protein TonB
VQFTVTKTGKVENILLVSSTDPVFINPALEIFRNMPAWNPGKQRNKPVQAQLIVPVRFRPDEE